MRTILIPIFSLCLLGAGCASSASDGGEPVVVATTSILGDVARNVVGGEGSVEVLMPPGTDPHDFEPSAQQGALIREADLVVANGLGLEESLAGSLEDAAEEAGNVLEVAPRLDPIPFSGSEALDPHVWMDPMRMAEAASLIADRLQPLAPGRWAARAETFAARLRALDEEIGDLLSPIERRELVTNHDAFGYLAARYDFEVVGVLIPGGSTLAEPSAEELAALAEVIRTRDVPAIFTETIHASGLAEAIAEEAGRPVELVTLYSDSLGEPGTPAGTYAGMLLTDARLIAEALT